MRALHAVAEPSPPAAAALPKASHEDQPFSIKTLWPGNSFSTALNVDLHGVTDPRHDVCVIKHDEAS